MTTPTSEPAALWPSQVSDLAFYIANPKCMNLSDPGTGKTPSVCVYMEYLAKHRDTLTIWAQPKSLLRKNKKELLRFTNLRESDIIIVDGTPKQRRMQMEMPGKVFLMGFKRFADDWKEFRRIHPKIKAIIIDEYHMGFKSMESKRTKELVSFTRAVGKDVVFLPMSGTIIDGRLDSCYSAVHIIEPRYYYDHNSFMAQHAYADEYGHVLFWINHEKIGRIFKRHAVRRTFKEVHGDEKPFISNELCEMNAAQREAFEEIREQAMLELDDEFLDAGNPAVAAMRCRQIMQNPEIFGLLKPGERTGKDESLIVHLEDHKERKKPLLIFSVFQPECERLVTLCREMGFRTELINGTVSAKRRGEIDLDFQNGLIDIVVASPETASVGFNWGHIDHIIFCSLDYKNSNFVQAYRRAIREKRKTPLYVTVLEYEDSIDQKIFSIVNRKSSDLHKIDETYEKLELGTK